MNGGSVEKAAQDCRDKILDRIGMREINNFEEAWVASGEVISEYIRKLLISDAEEIEKLVREKLKGQGVKQPSHRPLAPGPWLLDKREGGGTKMKECKICGAPTDGKKDMCDKCWEWYPDERGEAKNGEENYQNWFIYLCQLGNDRILAFQRAY